MDITYSSPCSKPCCTISLVFKQRIGSRIATPMYTSPAPVSSSSLKPYLVRTHFSLHHRPYSSNTRAPEFSTLSLTSDERAWLRNTCPYFKPAYIDYFSSYRFDPSQVRVTFVPRGPDSDEGRIEIEASGPWVEAILWEVPLMATLSEIYYTTVDKDWTNDGQAGTDRLHERVG
jgi:hypothetical protein